MRLASSALLVCVVWAVAACQGEPATPPPAPAPAPSPAKPEPAPAPTPTPVDDAQAQAEARQRAEAAAIAAEPNFNSQLAATFRVAACGGQDPVPERFSQKLVDTHCAALEKLLAEYKARWLDLAAPFLAKVVPAGLPDRVIYPFGGSDLVSALTVYPHAKEITIISLEKVGDPRSIDRIKGPDLVQSLADNRAHLAFLMRSAFHKTVDLKAMSDSGLPGELVDALVALKVHGATPLALRYFTLADDGTPTYVDNRFIDAEITFRRADGGLAVYRHIQANLANGPLKKNVGFLAYLAARAPYAAMTKASSFLLWEAGFSLIRDTVLSQAVCLVSDATAPMPDVMTKAGFTQAPYGRFDGPEPAFWGLTEKAAPVIKMWKASPGPMEFRFGYSDSAHHGHLLVSTRDPNAPPPAPAPDAPPTKAPAAP